MPDADIAAAVLRLGGLDLAPDRVERVAEWLSGLMPEVAATSERMAAMRDVAPLYVQLRRGAADG